ncbi:hypothetical protein D0T51_01720 [Parabacteroides sp. 52]|uniref:DUF6364 family protein n=1 Tax=unclassified Parabacteroides TaxID=2649774 RepID=UPI0013D3120E|nr:MULTISPECIES: DUF6364 family protein [unclassified Parabacteroides]MDH6533701.1 hypothetical protein [Parabacteroides sp. PM5-20]NDV54453.1 hypothetical protein [Parabacteroides sp. 52]
MNTKLTLNLNREIIKQAKLYAKDNRTSLSKLIENYLNSLTRNQEISIREISPLVESLTGVIDTGEIERKEYVDYLSEKYA